MKSLRIGCVKYLNARPLIRGWTDDVEFDHPSALCKRLANGDLDVALVSSFEFLRNPIYRIVDDISISSDGAVYSVVVAHQGEISEIDEIELDPASQTAVNLLRCLLAELKLRLRLTRNIDLQSVRPAGLQPAESHSAENFSAGHTGNMPMFPTAHRARLLIGDHAIRFRQDYADQVQLWDLGEQWKRRTGLPFVYALWLIRPEVANAKQIADRLRSLRDENLTELEGLVAKVVAGVTGPDHPRLDQQFLFRYYRENLRFSLGEKEKDGLRTFGKLCAKHGLLSKRDFTFNLV
ncbi:MAG TPA: menaquinone biosynthesis protein [Candidatus Udaeobacter sp.]